MSRNSVGVCREPEQVVEGGGGHTMPPGEFWHGVDAAGGLLAVTYSLLTVVLPALSWRASCRQLRRFSSRSRAISMGSKSSRRGRPLDRRNGVVGISGRNLGLGTADSRVDGQLDSMVAAAECEDFCSISAPLRGALEQTI